MSGPVVFDDAYEGGRRVAVKPEAVDVLISVGDDLPRTAVRGGASFAVKVSLDEVARQLWPGKEDRRPA